MENFPYNSSYPDSVNSSPRSREVDLENSSWDEPISNSSANYKVKFMCSYGGKIHPRPHDNQLTYVGGDTKILSVDRNSKYSGFISKLSSLCDASEVYFKYQLPGEDLDALISVTNDEDLEHMMLEYDRLYRSSAKPARLRLFIFPVNFNPAATSSFGSNDSKSERQWFVDALNSVQLNQNLEESSTPASVTAAAEVEAKKKDTDFLFGLDKSHQQPPARLQDPLTPVAPTVVVEKEFAVGNQERHVIGEPVMSAQPPPEFQRQIQELQRMQISHDQQAVPFNRNFDEYYQEKAPPPPQPHPAAPMSNPAAYWKEGHEVYPPAGTNEPQQVYLIQTPTGVYQTQAPPGMRPATGQVSHQQQQAYYGVQQRMVPPEVYREQQQQQQQVYNTNMVVPQPQVTQQQKFSGAYTSEGMGLVRPPQAQVTDAGYGHVGFDGAGRQMYYAAQPPGGLMQPPPQYTAVPPMAGGVDARQSGGRINQDGKIMVKATLPM